MSTHRDSHPLAVVHVHRGAVVSESTIDANSDSYVQVLKLVGLHAPGRRASPSKEEGSFGAGLARFLTVRGERVLEVGRLRRDRRLSGPALRAVAANSPRDPAWRAVKA